MSAIKRRERDWRKGEWREGHGEGVSLVLVKKVVVMVWRSLRGVSFHAGRVWECKSVVQNMKCNISIESTGRLAWRVASWTFMLRCTPFLFMVGVSEPSAEM